MVGHSSIMVPAMIFAKNRFFCVDLKKDIQKNNYNFWSHLFIKNKNI